MYGSVVDERRGRSTDLGADLQPVTGAGAVLVVQGAVPAADVNASDRRDAPEGGLRERLI